MEGVNNIKVRDYYIKLKDLRPFPEKYCKVKSESNAKVTKDDAKIFC